MRPRNLTMLVRAMLLSAMLFSGSSQVDAGGSQPEISIGNARVIEGDSLSVRARFAVTATGPVCAPISVDFSTFDGSASAASGDYATTSGTLTLIPDEPQFSGAWTGGGTGFVSSIIAGRNDDLFAADLLSNRVMQFDRRLNPIRSWGTEGTGAGEFSGPRDIAQDDEGNLYVADSGNHRIQKFDELGNYLAEWGSEGSGPGQFDFFLLAIAIDAANNVYVSDRAQNAMTGRIQKFDRFGTFIAEWPTTGARPLELAIGTNGRIYANVWDPSGTVAKIEVYESDGTLVSVWNGTSTAGQLRGGGRITLDGCGHVWIVDDDRLVVTDEDGTFLTEHPIPPVAEERVPDFPSALCADNAGRLFLAHDGAPYLYGFSITHSGAIEVPVTGDTSFESDESFSVVLSNPQNGMIAGSTGEATIVNDDANVGPNLLTNSSFDTLDGWAPIYGASLSLVPDGHDDGSAVLVTVSPDSIKSFGINDSPDAIASADSAWARYRFSAWVRLAGGGGLARLRVREYFGTELQGTRVSSPVLLDSTWRYIAISVLTVFGGSHFDFQVLMDPDGPGAAFVVDDIAIERLLGDAPPYVIVPPLETHGWLRSMSIPVQVRDPDGDAIRSLTADLSQLPAGNNARFTTKFDRASGVLRWEPGLLAVRREPYRVVVRAGNSFEAEDTIEVRVTENVAENATFEAGVGGWNGDQGVVLEEISPGRTDGHALRATNTLGLSNFGINDSPNWADSPAQATALDFSAWVRSPNSAGPVWLWVREYHNGELINSETGFRVPVSSEWIQLQFSYSSLRPIGGTNSTIDFQIMMAAAQIGATTGTPLVGEQLEVDDVSITFTHVPPLAVPQVAGNELDQLVSPNPMRGAATLRLATTRRGPLHAAIFDLNGRVVRVLADERDAAAGERSWSLRARDAKGRMMPAGVYFYRVSSADGVRRGRFVVLN